MLKINEDQATKMAYATITKDETDDKRKMIVKEILEEWKNRGYIEGYDEVISCCCEERAK